MRAKPQLKFDPAMAAKLACPVCFGSLRADSPSLVCGACGRAYPIVDGIPVLIAERANAPAQEEVQPKRE
jgi:uncharacterized protein